MDPIPSKIYPVSCITTHVPEIHFDDDDDDDDDDDGYVLQLRSETIAVGR